jgi:hypothetical protein
VKSYIFPPYIAKQRQQLVETFKSSVGMVVIACNKSYVSFVAGAEEPGITKVGNV